MLKKGPAYKGVPLFDEALNVPRRGKRDCGYEKDEARAVLFVSIVAYYPPNKSVFVGVIHRPL